MADDDHGPAEVGKWLKALNDWTVELDKRSLMLGLAPKLRDAAQEIALEVTGFDQTLQREDGGALAVQTCAFLFPWLKDLAAHPLIDAAVFEGLQAAWPAPVTAMPAALAVSLYGAVLPPLTPSVLTLADDNKLLADYVSLCRRTAALLLGQMKVCECPSLDSFNEFSRDSLALRRAYACSTPTEAALRALAALGPLLEVGGGSGYWASLLRARGADVKCFNSAAWEPAYNAGEAGEDGHCGRADAGVFGDVLPGGPEVIREHADRTLVLMWPDHRGKGSFGVKCLEEYEGETLVLVGEWRGRTFGAYAAGLDDHGQSFSPEFQAQVAGAYDEQEVYRLPNWPLFLDCVMVYKRKSAGAEPCGGAGEDDVVSMFLSGATDPFAAIEHMSEITGGHK